MSEKSPVADVVGVREGDPLRPGRAPGGRLRGLAETVAQGGLDCGCESNVGTDCGVVPEGRAVQETLCLMFRQQVSAPVEVTLHAAGLDDEMVLV